MITAAERLAVLDDLPAAELCSRAETTLDALVTIINEETTRLRAGYFRNAAELAAEKARLAEEYVGLVRSIQRETVRLMREAPGAISRLRSGHERLATQLADNLRVIATARTVTEELLTDVAEAVGQKSRTRTYGATGEISEASTTGGRGIAINRAL